MRLKTLFEKFEQFVDASNAVQRMRELVLDLAVRGKLVNQDSRDEPAIKLLAKYEANNKRLLTKAETKKLGELAEVSIKEYPYDLPLGWTWCRFGSLGLIGSSTRVHKKDWTKSGVPFLRAREIVQLSKFGNCENELFITEELFQRLAREGHTPEPMDVMITGVGTIGVPYIVKKKDRFYFKDASVLIFKNRVDVNPKYVSTLLRSPFGISEMHKGSMGTTVHTLTIIRANSALFPLPPLAEQKRIVAKVDEMMALCDTLEAQQKDREEKHTQLVRASLSRFADAPTPANLEFLFHKSYDVSPADLRKTILTLAVQGKLVPQDPKDEPAQTLASRIATEKLRLVRSKDIKVEQPLMPIAEDEALFAIPDSWTWLRAGDLCRPISSGSTPDKRFFCHNDGIPYLKVYNIRGQAIDFDYKPQYINPDYHAEKMKRSKLIPGDVVMNIVGPPLGKVAIVPDTFSEWNCNQAIAFFRPVFPECAPYLYTFIKQGGFLQNIKLIGTAGQDNISVTKCKFIPVPLPPLAEQRRIVAKVDELMNLVDQLEEQQKQSRDLAEKLLEALVAELTSGNRAATANLPSTSTTNREAKRGNRTPRNIVAQAIDDATKHVRTPH